MFQVCWKIVPLLPSGSLVTWKSVLQLKVVGYLAAVRKGPLSVTVTFAAQGGMGERTGSWDGEWKVAVNKGLKMGLKLDHNCHVDVGFQELWRRAQKMDDAEKWVR